MYKIIFDKEVEKFLKKQDTTMRRRIRDSLLELAENPYQSSHVKKLKIEMDNSGNGSGISELFTKLSMSNL